MKDSIKYSDCPNSEYQINKLREENKKLKQSLNQLANELLRVKEELKEVRAVLFTDYED